MELALPFSLEALCTYYLSEWQMFLKWWCLMCAELLPKPYCERPRDFIHHLMVETSTDEIPTVASVKQQRGCCYQGGPLRWWQHFGQGLDFTAAAQNSTSRVTFAHQNWICRVRWICFGGCNSYYLQRADININKDGKQICKLLCSSTNWAERKRAFLQRAFWTVWQENT